MTHVNVGADLTKQVAVLFSHLLIHLLLFQVLAHWRARRQLEVTELLLKSHVSVLTWCRRAQLHNLQARHQFNLGHIVDSH